jgi:hypothetical protein
MGMFFIQRNEVCLATRLLLTKPSSFTNFKKYIFFKKKTAYKSLVVSTSQGQKVHMVEIQ